MNSWTKKAITGKHLHYMNEYGKICSITIGTAIALLDDNSIIWYTGKNHTIIAEAEADGDDVIKIVRALTNSHNTKRIKANIIDCCGGSW